MKSTDIVTRTTNAAQNKSFLMKRLLKEKKELEWENRKMRKISTRIKEEEDAEKIAKIDGNI